VRSWLTYPALRSTESAAPAAFSDRGKCRGHPMMREGRVEAARCCSAMPSAMRRALSAVGRGREFLSSTYARGNPLTDLGPRLTSSSSSSSKASKQEEEEEEEEGGRRR
jgi:hypothetical protein